MTNTVLKTQIDTDITNKITANSITPGNVGVNMKAVVDYADQQDLLSVHLTGDETISGNKSFINNITVANITANNITASSFIKSGGTSSQFLKADGSSDSNTYANDTTVVHLAGNETITGRKDFTDSFGLKANNIELKATIAAFSPASTHVMLGTNGTSFCFREAGQNEVTLSSAGINAGRVFSFQDQSGVLALTNNPTSLTAVSFIKSGGNSTQFLKADGSSDSTVLSATYTPTITNNVLGTVSATTVKTTYQRIGNIVTLNYGFTATASTGLCTFTITLPLNRGTNASYPLGSGTIQYASGYAPLYVDSSTFVDCNVKFNAPASTSYSGNITLQYSLV